MKPLNGRRCCSLVALVLLACFASKTVAAELPGTDSDGWHTWRVRAVEGAPDRCCYRWNRGVAHGKVCNLDRGHESYLSTDDSSNTSGEVQIYTLLRSGNVTKIRSFNTQCAVTAESTIVDLGTVDVDDSVDWLQPHIRTESSISSGTLAAIAAHDGGKSHGVLLDAATFGSDLEIRKEAYFWMALVRGADSPDDIKRLMFEDTSSEFREHAAFAFSQSTIANRSAALIRLGNDDASANVRSQAWFWLAQTGAGESEVAITSAISQDRNRDVREEAVFALSQLPEKRAIRALAAILENRNLDKDLRTEALFWLAQSDSDAAFVYVDRLLSER